MKKPFLLIMLLSAFFGAFAAEKMQDDPKFFTTETKASEVIAEFELLDRDGNVKTMKDFQGSNVLVAFGYSKCRHICPMTGKKISDVINNAEAKKVIGLMISIDSERDTSADIDDFVKQQYSDKQIGLAGDYAAAHVAATNFKAAYKVTKSNEGYQVSHTGDLYLIDPTGKVVEVFALKTPTEQIVNALK